MIFDFWIDSDSLPKTLRPIVLNAAVRNCAAAYFVADRSLPDVQLFIAEDTHRIRVESNDKSLKSKIKMVVVKTGENSADDYIVENANPNSICITHDIPLASRLLDKNCIVLDDRGGEYTKENIGQRLSERNVNAELRIWGVFDTQKKQTQSNIKEFADSLDRTITRIKKIQ